MQCTTVQGHRARVNLSSNPFIHFIFFSGTPCGVEYFVRAYVLSQDEKDEGRPSKKSIVSMMIRKIQYAPMKPGRQPCTMVKKDFMFSPGELELEATLDQQLYHHGDTVCIHVSIKNNSNKMVKKISAHVLRITFRSMA